MVSLFMLLLAVAPAAARMHDSSSALLQVSARLRSVTLNSSFTFDEGYLPIFSTNLISSSILLFILIIICFDYSGFPEISL